MNIYKLFLCWLHKRHIPIVVFNKTGLRIRQCVRCGRKI